MYHRSGAGQRHAAMACAAAVVAVLFPAAASATNYQIQSIVDSASSSFSEFGYAPTINDSGQVAFTAGTGFSNMGAYIKTGSSLGTVVAPGAYQGFVYEPIINNVGDVVFTVSTTSLSTEIRKGNASGTTLVALADMNHTPSGAYTFANVYQGSINDAGVVSFAGTIYEQSGPGYGGTFTASSNGISYRFASTSPFARINNAGQLAFIASFEHPPTDPSLQEAALVRLEPNGSFKKLGSAVPYGPYGVLDARPGINSAGNVMFQANETIPNPDGITSHNTNTIYAFNGDKLLMVAKQTVNQYNDPKQYTALNGGPAISNNGVTAFSGAYSKLVFEYQDPDFPNEPPYQQFETRDGIFTGPDPTKDRVIEVGDTIDGLYVASISFVAGINTHGQIVFTYGLAQDAFSPIIRRGIAVATPDTSKPLSQGAAVPTTVGGALPGRLDATFDQITSDGRFSADFFQAVLADGSNVSLLDELAVRIGAEAAAEASGFNLTSADNFQAWNLDFSGDFASEVQLVFHYDPTTLDVAEADLVIRHFENGEWITPSQTLDTLNNTITLDTGSFSPFVLSAVPEPGAVAAVAAASTLLMARRRRMH